MEAVAASEVETGAETEAPSPPVSTATEVEDNNSSEWTIALSLLSLEAPFCFEL